ncbi:hypothetical protein Tco_1385074 [Tanacetum coccineum]
MTLGGGMTLTRDLGTHLEIDMMKERFAKLLLGYMCVGVVGAAEYNVAKGNGLVVIILKKLDAMLISMLDRKKSGGYRIHKFLPRDYQRMQQKSCRSGHKSYIKGNFGYIKDLLADIEIQSAYLETLPRYSVEMVIPHIVSCLHISKWTNEFDKKTLKIEQMQADTQQQRDPNRDRRRAAYKYRLSKEVRTKVDEEQNRQTAITDLDRQQTTYNRFRQQQIQTAPQTADITNQTISDAERGKTIRN